MGSIRTEKLWPGCFFYFQGEKSILFAVSMSFQWGQLNYIGKYVEIFQSHFFPDMDELWPPTNVMYPCTYVWSRNLTHQLAGCVFCFLMDKNETILLLQNYIEYCRSRTCLMHLYATHNGSLFWKRLHCVSLFSWPEWFCSVGLITHDQIQTLLTGYLYGEIGTVLSILHLALQYFLNLCLSFRFFL